MTVFGFDLSLTLKSSSDKIANEILVSIHYVRLLNTTHKYSIIL